MQKLTNIFLTKRFYLTILSISTILILGHFMALLFVIGKLALLVFASLLLVELFMLINGGLAANRTLPERFSNGDYNAVNYTIVSNYLFAVNVTFTDELPYQFQVRDFTKILKLQAKQTYNHPYSLRPVERGIYKFGQIRLFASTNIGFISMRFSCDEPKDVAVYPSFLNLKKTEILAFSNNRHNQTAAKIQRPGNSKEFDQIKEYVIGDDYRKLNWKATARFNKLMVNEYQEERSRHIYQLIDMGRTMKMPFEGMTLLDYAINSSLAVANIILKKHDKTGLITYSTKIHSIVKSNSRSLQMNTILETLYAQKTSFSESNLEQVYTSLEKNASGRSLLIFYSNYESNQSLERQLPILKQLAKRHLLMLVTFTNTEMEMLVNEKAESYEGVYKKTLAENHLIQNELLMDTLYKYGIIHVKTRPNELTLAVINKYLEIKHRGLI